MSDETPRLKLAELVSLQELNAITWNEALAQIDALVDLYLLGQFVNTPPASPQDGDAYLIGGAPTGAWSGYAYKIASCLDGAWRYYLPFNGLRAYVATSGAFIVYLDGQWVDWNALISAREVSYASAATCDLGAAGALFVLVTGTTAITSFGTSANKLRFVRFAQGLTLTHNATSLVLLGGASRTTAAGDVGLYASDASGNWRERAYFRANAAPVLPSAAFAAFAGVGQLPFPAAQLASTDPNTLDDYEEGTFTPVFTAGTTPPTGTVQTASGRYVKIGCQVFCSLFCQITNLGTNGTGEIQIAGFPFPVNWQFTGVSATTGAAQFSLFTFPSGVTQLSLSPKEATSCCRVIGSGSAIATPVLQWSALAANAYISGGVIYTN